MWGDLQNNYENKTKLLSNTWYVIGTVLWVLHKKDLFNFRLLEMDSVYVADFIHAQTETPRQ